MLVSSRKFEAIAFTLDPPKKKDTTLPSLSAKEVQAAIKAGTATREILQGEIIRINSREVRSTELDRDNVQKKVHAEFEQRTEAIGTTQAATPAELIGVRLLIYQSLSYSDKHAVDELLKKSDADWLGGKIDMSISLAELSDEQVAFMIRLAVAGKCESKYPNNPTGKMLYAMASGIGVDVPAIEQEQQNKKTKRNINQEAKIKLLQARIDKIPAPEQN